MNAARRRRSRGTSTADVLVGMALSLVILGGIYSFFQAQQKALAAQSTYSQSQSVTRTVMEFVMRELRMATYDPTLLALPVTPGPCCPGLRQGITEATPTRLHFRQDLNGNGTVDAANEDIVYELVNGQVQRTDRTGTTVTLAANVPVGGFRFRYYDGGNPAAELVPSPSLSSCQRDCVAKVQLTVQANLPNPDTHIATPVKSLVRSEVAIRNRSLLNF